ncbi:hypothetical protein H1V43_07060 [Streptomyces sp. PSKA54]|uniref:Uncharacterized protein n=1 Tax=Streptomyces himalayensis subsp. aureolus TaxID=2758039 RepID=A0A7W2CY03_9ACTN|nr:hypothetical protein [Streptomyces himalayensis]MBA4861144.1 hypothetical protein [Streptomyces himalayensis subsp. aureolus]
MMADLSALLRDWPNYPVDAKRAQLDRTVDSVIVRPAGRGKRFDPALVEILWKRRSSDTDSEPSAP